MKNFDLSRRTFLRRSALLVGSVGLGASMQSSVMDHILRKAKRTFGTALANEPGIVDYSIEICFRLGFQTNTLFPSEGHSRPIGERFGPDQLNFYYDSSAVQAAPAGNGRDLYLTRFGLDANQNLQFGLDNPLAAYASNLAVSEAIGDNGNFSHTDAWSQRYPSAMAPNPSLMHARHAPADVPVKGVLWEGGANVDHSPTSGFSPLQAVVPDDQSFVGLFKELPLPFTRQELSLVVGAFDDSGVLTNPRVQHNLDSMWRSSTRLQTVDGPASLVTTGRGLTQVSHDLTVLDPNNQFVLNGLSVPASQTIATNLPELANEFKYQDFNMSLGGVHWGHSMMQLYRAMAAGLVRTAVINVQTGDWHSDRPAIGDTNSKQYLWAAVLTGALNNFMRFAAATDSAFGDYKMADSLLISLTSEFSRTPFNRGRTDNGDGAAQSCVFLGSKVNGGTLGNIDTLMSNPNIGNDGYGDERVIAFDPTDGTLTNGPRISAGSIWKTHMDLLGINESDYSMYNVDGQVASTLVRSS